ncbi:MAG: hypothetical protein M1826_006923 [Phylliscum demangeonii]|nr:MAG: hypothetical protein M1826_006923 [Phylliscum demangeonii]
MQHIILDRSNVKAPTRDHPPHKALAQHLPEAQQSHHHPFRAGAENARIFFVGTATTILEWEGIRLMTDVSRVGGGGDQGRVDWPNFLHAGDHVHLGPGVTAVRQTNPAVDLHDLPRIDLVCLSHYHEDHFDREVEASLRRDLPIITTPHAKHHLDEAKAAEERFTAVTALDTFESCMVTMADGADKGAAGRGGTADPAPAMQVTAMPGKHVPPGVLSTVNDLLGAVPPTNGWMIELGHLLPSASSSGPRFESGYRIYISGDTLLVDELKQIPVRYAHQPIDLMLVHLGGTTIPSAKLPLLMVTMDAAQGIGLIRLLQPDVTLPIHYDDYDLFLVPLDEFRSAVADAGLQEKVVFWDRGEEYVFRVRAPT